MIPLSLAILLGAFLLFQVQPILGKYAIPLMEYLDRERITRRVGETRVLL